MARHVVAVCPGALRTDVNSTAALHWLRLYNLTNSWLSSKFTIGAVLFVLFFHQIILFHSPFTKFSFLYSFTVPTQPQSACFTVSLLAISSTQSNLFAIKRNRKESGPRRHLLSSELAAPVTAVHQMKWTRIRDERHVINPRNVFWAVFFKNSSIRNQPATRAFFVGHRTFSRRINEQQVRCEVEREKSPAVTETSVHTPKTVHNTIADEMLIDNNYRVRTYKSTICIRP